MDGDTKSSRSKSLQIAEVLYFTFPYARLPSSPRISDRHCGLHHLTCRTLRCKNSDLACH